MDIEAILLQDIHDAEDLDARAVAVRTYLVYWQARETKKNLT